MSSLDDLVKDCPEAVNIEPSNVYDGLFKRNINGDKIYTTPFPLSSIGYTFSKELAELVGGAIGKECLSLNGNPVRLCNTDYSEDDIVSARLIANIIGGIEGEGVTGIVRFPLFSDVDFAYLYLEKRTFFERFIKPFEIVLREGKPSIVECSTSIINGKPICDNKELVLDIKKSCDALIALSCFGVLEKENVFNSGIDLLFENKRIIFSQHISEQKKIDLNERLSLSPRPCDMERHKELSSRLALESIVMLENKGIFPLKKDYTLILEKNGALTEDLAYYLTKEGYNIAFLREKEILKLQNTEEKTIVLLTDIKEVVVQYLLGKAIKVAAIAFNEIHPLHKKLDGVFFCKNEDVFLEGVAKLISGECSPSGRLAYSLDERQFEKKSEILLKDGVYHGYKMYEKLGISPLYSFGHGLSYSTIIYTGLECKPLSFYENTPITVKVRIRNNSDVKGKHSVLLFVKGPKTRLSKPAKKLVDFEKIELMPHQEKSIFFNLNTSDFAYYNEEEKGFCVETGIYKLVLVDEKGEEALSKEIQIFSKYPVAPPESNPSYYEDLSKALQIPDEEFKRLCLDGVDINNENIPLKALKSAKNIKIYYKIKKAFEVSLKDNTQMAINNIDDLPLRLLRVLGETSLLELALNRLDGR